MVRGTVGGGSGGKGGSLETGKGMGWIEVSDLHLGNSEHVLGELREEGRARGQTCENRVSGWLTWEDGK